MAVNILGHIFWWTYGHTFVGYIARYENNVTSSNFVGNASFQKGCTNFLLPLWHMSSPLYHLSCIFRLPTYMCNSLGGWYKDEGNDEKRCQTQAKYKNSSVYMKENNHLHIEDHIVQEHSEITGTGRKRQEGFHSHESPTKPQVANNTNWGSSKNFTHLCHSQGIFMHSWITTILESSGELSVSSPWAGNWK